MLYHIAWGLALFIGILLLPSWLALALLCGHYFSSRIPVYFLIGAGILDLIYGPSIEVFSDAPRALTFTLIASTIIIINSVLTARTRPNLYSI